MSSALLFLLLAVAIPLFKAHIPYWTDYWGPGYPPYEYPPSQQNYHYPPKDQRIHQQPTRGEDAYPGKFLGMGTVKSHYGGRQVELVCSLNSGEGNVVSNVVWTKIKGYYPIYENPPPYDCPKCTFFPISYDEHRIKAYDYQGKSILLIQEVHQEDYGIYRCSATTQVSPWGNIETVYQVVKF